jgi:hypothetical protein
MIVSDLYHCQKSSVDCAKGRNIPSAAERSKNRDEPRHSNGIAKGVAKNLAALPLAPTGQSKVRPWPANLGDHSCALASASRTSVRGGTARWESRGFFARLHPSAGNTPGENRRSDQARSHIRNSGRHHMILRHSRQVRASRGPGSTCRKPPASRCLPTAI